MLCPFAIGQPRPTINASPNQLTLRAGTIHQYTYVVTNLTGTPSLAWTVNGIAGGNATLGTISATGLYTAPLVPPTPETVNIRVELKIPNPAVGSVNPSETVTARIQQPVPIVTSTSPARVKIGTFTLNIIGSGFTSTSQPRLNGTAMTLTSWTPTHLTATGTLVATNVGANILTVYNPGTGAATSLPDLVMASAYDGTEKMTSREAARFLEHATFGPRSQDVDRLQAIGYFSWIDEQAGMLPTVIPSGLDAKPLEWAQDAFFKIAVSSDDQLRQRMAFALHQIFVVSGVEVDNPTAYLSYFRILQRGSLGSFKQLMRDIALNPAMGEYLDMVNNDKAAPGKSPNENFARELLQLFSLGLTRLGPDGVPELDAFGKPKSTYTEADVQEMARVFTGWTYAPKPGQTTRGHNPKFYGAPMVAYDPNHDQGIKRLLDGTMLPANNGTVRDFDTAIDRIFAHGNIAPFISKNLIQHLVTSNPSPAYIRRVASVFRSSNGDLKAVAKAILTDVDASGPLEWPGVSVFAPGTVNTTIATFAPNAGHLREPVLYTAALARLLTARIADHPFMTDESTDMGQRLFYSPSVFNYFSPSYRAPGVGIAGPEFQILTAQTALRRVNFAGKLIYGYFGNDVTLDIARYIQAAPDIDTLLTLVNVEVMGSRMSALTKEAIRKAVLAQSDSKEKARTALYLALTSSLYQVIQ